MLQFLVVYNIDEIIINKYKNIITNVVFNYEVIKILKKHDQQHYLSKIQIPLQIYRINVNLHQTHSSLHHIQGSIKL